MQTEIYRIDPADPDESVIRRAGEIVRRGGLVAFPTETVYGLGGNALDPEASEKIYAAKGRPSDNPLIVHIADMEALGAVAEEIPESARKLAEAFWPGPLTMIFKKTETVPERTSGGLPTVAVRMPDNRTALMLIRASGGYIAAPSANLSGRPSPTTAAHVEADLNGRIDCILDGGPVLIGLESTIVDLTEEIPVILRPGKITEEMLRDILGEVRTDPGILGKENTAVRPKAPGMRYRHYAPKAPLVIVEGPEENVTAAIRRHIDEKKAEGLRVGVIASDSTGALYGDAAVMSLGSRDRQEEIAANLFAVLRRMDDEDVDMIYSESFETPGIGQAVMNRLLKAAGHNIEYV